MADRIEIDLHELDAIGREIAVATAAAESQARPVMQKAGVVMKDALRSDLRASKHFAGIAGDVSFDTTVTAAGIDLEVGLRSGPGQPGALGNVAYFGTSRGGGTVPDPVHALEDELPNVEQHLLGILGRLL